MRAKFCLLPQERSAAIEIETAGGETLRMGSWAGSWGQTRVLGLTEKSKVPEFFLRQGRFAWGLTPRPTRSVPHLSL